LTKLPLIVKGICHPDDARRAIDGGVDGIYCSNHGGRQANGGLAAIDLLPERVNQTVGGRITSHATWRACGEFAAGILANSASRCIESSPLRSATLTCARRCAP
jgi:FMN-dependent dehydrogenase